jgi:hypothetical protein
MFARTTRKCTKTKDAQVCQQQTQHQEPKRQEETQHTQSNTIHLPIVAKLVDEWALDTTLKFLNYKYIYYVLLYAVGQQQSMAAANQAHGRFSLSYIHVCGTAVPTVVVLEDSDTVNKGTYIVACMLPWVVARLLHSRQHCANTYRAILMRLAASVGLPNATFFITLSWKKMRTALGIHGIPGVKKSKRGLSFLTPAGLRAVSIHSPKVRAWVTAHFQEGGNALVNALFIGGVAEHGAFQLVADVHNESDYSG